MPIECFHDSFAVSRFLQSLVCETRAAMGVITALRRWTDLFFVFCFSFFHVQFPQSGGL